MNKYVNTLVLEIIEATNTKRIAWTYNKYCGTFYSNKNNFPFQIEIVPPTKNLFDLFSGFFPTIIIRQNSIISIERTIYSWKIGKYLIRTIKRSMQNDADFNFIYDLTDVIDILVQEKQNSIALDQAKTIELPIANKK